VLDWFRRIRKVSRKLTLPSRDASSGRSQVQLNPQKLTPSAEIYLGQLSYLSLVTAQILENDSVLAPSTSYRQKQLKVAEVYRERHRELTSMLSKLGKDAVDIEDRFGPRIDELFERTAGVGWHESLMRLHIALGILEHSAKSVGKGLTSATRNKVEDLLKNDLLAQYCSTALKSELQKRPEIAGRLAMYGRSLVADVLLEVRNSVSLEKVLTESPADKIEKSRAEFKVLEPYVSELIASHTVRMDELGLTA
jgi:tRNA-(MS[2]IO[6]A)-hydroxylase (MiaE)-like